MIQPKHSLNFGKISLGVNPKEIVIFSGTSNTPLAKRICELLGLPFNIGVSHFGDQEIKGKLIANVRGKHVFLIDSTNPPAENWDELCFMIDAARRASAKEITVIMPYSGYSRQERKDEPRVSISHKVKLRQLESAGANRIISCDLHAAASQGFVDIPYDNLFCTPFLLAPFAEFFTPQNLKNTCLVTDLGYAKIASVYARLLNCELVFARKKRKGGDKPDELEEEVILVGNVEKQAIIIDDIASTFRTANRIGRAVKKAGAEYIAATMVHPVLSEDKTNPEKDVMHNIQESPFDDFVFTDTVFIPDEKLHRIKTILETKHKRIHFVSCALLLAQAIKEIYEEGSVSNIFENGQKELLNLVKSLG